jgi:Flp pilus assembly protein TadD
MSVPQQAGGRRNRSPLIAWVLLPVLIVALVAPLGFVGFNIYQEMLRPPPVATPIALPPATPIPIVTPFATITPPPGRPTPTPPQMGELLASAQRSYDTANYDQAEDLYRWALNIDPRSAEAMTGLGWTLYELERYAEAHDAFVQSRDIDPDQSAVYNGLGWIAYANSDDRQAYAHFYKSVTIEPANANAYYGLGLTSERMGKNREAREAYQAALEIDPNDQAVHERLERLE